MRRFWGPSLIQELITRFMALECLLRTDVRVAVQRHSLELCIILVGATLKLTLQYIKSANEIRTLEESHIKTP